MIQNIIINQKVDNQLALGAEESQHLDAYVSSRLLLIRDIQDVVMAA
jgi:hypothetical protein